MAMEIREDGQEEGRGRLRQAVYSLHEVAELLNESYPATWGSFSSGKLPWEPIRIGRKVFFKRSEIDRDLGIEQD